MSLDGGSKLLANTKSFKDECGVFGIWNHREASRLTYLGLYAIQHRGQESAGIVSLEHMQHHIHKGLGLVHDIFTEERLNQLPGRAAIGHVRYSTTGRNYLNNAQPLTASLLGGPVALAHNGNIVNAHLLKRELREMGAIFQGSTDTEALLHMIARHPSNNLVDCLKSILNRVEGAYSLTVLSHQSLVGVRDPHGFRPLVYGTLENGEGGLAHVLASETCAFDLIGAKYVREIEPGEIFYIDAEGVHSISFAKALKISKCIFEYVYFSRPDSLVFGQSVYEIRKEMGRTLARENKVAADVVVPVPDSGVPAAIGFSEASGIPFDLGIIRNHYVGRTFIQPEHEIRSFGVRVKLNPQSAVLQGKRVILIDDSLVRGTTSKKILSLVRHAVAKEVHLRIAAPPTTGPCYYGVDTPSKKELIASNQTLEQIRKFVEVDSLSYLSLDGLLKSAKSSGYCAACFDGKYPTPLYDLENQPKEA